MHLKYDMSYQNPFVVKTGIIQNKKVRAMIKYTPNARIVKSSESIRFYIQCEKRSRRAQGRILIICDIWALRNDMKC